MTSHAIMTPAQTVTFICGVIMCIIGVATFVSALLTKARKDGQLEYKVDAALKGIDEIKSTLNHTQSWQESISLKVQSHEEQIITLFNNQAALENRVNLLIERKDM